MSNRKSFITGTLLGLTLAGATAVLAMPGPDRGGFGGAGRDHGVGIMRQLARVERLADQLDLTDSQREAARDAVDAAFDAARPILRELSDNRRDLRVLVREDAAEVDTVTAIAERQGDLVSELIVMRVNLRAELRGILTDEQIAQLENRIRARFEG
ncbi:MAG: Spy/CpxP family protein refolding chaperone [Pseudomonadota bacterium]